REIRKILRHADPTFKAMVLLGINCGFSNNDCATLEFSHLDLEKGWHNFPRPKTGIQRRSPLWPETVKAIREAIANRAKPRTAELRKRVFLTTKGSSWCRTAVNGDPLSKRFHVLLQPLDLHEEGRNFQSLRRTTQTVGR